MLIAEILFSNLVITYSVFFILIFPHIQHLIFIIKYKIIFLLFDSLVIVLLLVLVFHNIHAHSQYIHFFLSFFLFLNNPPCFLLLVLQNVLFKMRLHWNLMVFYFHFLKELMIPQILDTYSLNRVFL